VQDPETAKARTGGLAWLLVASGLAMLACACNLLTGASSLEESSCSISCDAGHGREAGPDARLDGAADGSRDSLPDVSRADADSGPAPRDAGMDSPPSVYASTVLMDDPVAYYRLDELSGDALDRGSAHANGVYGAETTRGAAGLLTGDSDLAVGIVPMDAGVPAIVSVANNLRLEPAMTMTVECWIRASSHFSGSGRIVSYGQDETSPYETYVLQAFDGHAEMYLANVGYVTGSTVLSNATTYYLAATYDGASLIVYVNGNVDGTKSFSGAIGPYGMTPGLGIGGGASGVSAADQFDGTIDEVAIYGSALTGTRIAAHYDAGR
jgi:Concanavalin A-like lectin/glucanases superfamily